MKNVMPFSRRPRLSSRNRLKALRRDDRKLGKLVPFSATGEWPPLIGPADDWSSETLMRYGERLALTKAGYVL